MWCKLEAHEWLSRTVQDFTRVIINTLRPRQDSRHFPDDIFKRIFLNENVWILISRKFVPKGPVNNIPALVQIMAWRRPGDKPLFEPMMVSLLTQICVTRPQWVKLVALKCYRKIVFPLKIPNRLPQQLIIKIDMYTLIVCSSTIHITSTLNKSLVKELNSPISVVFV